MAQRTYAFRSKDADEQRLDRFLTACLPQYSRARLQALIRGGLVNVDGVAAQKTGQLISPGVTVTVVIPPPLPAHLAAEAIPLDIVFENEDVIVVNKAAGMVVHPAAGHHTGTLVNAALGHAPGLQVVGGEERPGVVHRLDKDTSGLIVLARNDAAQHWLQDQFRLRTVEKTYLALVDGRPPSPSGRVEAPIGRDPTKRKQMAIVRADRGRTAITEYRTLESFPEHTLLEFHPLTGRTHQIRVHARFLKCPIVGDTVYGLKKPSLPLQRQFLHAAKLTLTLPGESHPRAFKAPLPRDLEDALAALRGQAGTQISMEGENRMKYIDLRSDTVTQPTPEMREAMARAEVGDDVFGDDPTVNRLQAVAAELTGKEAALFVPSGTMGNLAGILAHCQRGDELIIGNKNHSFLFEAGGISALGGIHSYQIPNQADGSLRLEDVEAAIRPDDPHDPITRLVCLENTHNRCGGTVQDVSYTRAVAEFAHDHGLSVHLDGARLFNAAAALGVGARELADPVDSVTFCLSKALCAPVGSLLCGTREFIRKAHRARKMLGGGMRQAGVLAAAGLVALETMISRLGEDHARARNLALGLRPIPGVMLDPGTPATNMVFFTLGADVKQSVQELESMMREKGILIVASGARRFRFVTHYWIDDKAVDRTVAAMAEALR